MPIPTPYLTLAQEIAARCQAYDVVEAVAIGGSLAAGHASEMSDMDLYLYLAQPLTHEQRREIVVPYASRWQHVDYWGPADVFFDTNTGLEVELVQFNVTWFTDQITRVMDDHQPSMGYSTSFWYTLRQSHIVYDRNSWLTDLKASAQKPYPMKLARNIVAHNYALLSYLIPAYPKQIKNALLRQDFVTINHDLADLFNSYFDILFAVNHQLHPGQKRRVELAARLCHTLPDAMQDDVTRVLQNASNPDLLDALDTLLRHLGEWLANEGYGIV